MSAPQPSLEAIKRLFDVAIETHMEASPEAPDPASQPWSSDSRLAPSAGTEDFINFLSSVPGNKITLGIASRDASGNDTPVPSTSTCLSPAPSAGSPGNENMDDIPSPVFEKMKLTSSENTLSPVQTRVVSPMPWSSPNSMTSVSPCSMTSPSTMPSVSPCSMKSPSVLTPQSPFDMTLSNSLTSPSPCSMTSHSSSNMTSPNIMTAETLGGIQPVDSVPVSVSQYVNISPAPSPGPSGRVTSSAASRSPSPSTSTSTGNAPLLPPCRVCGEKASGFHYGANTCEACKGFFRRSLARKANYRCAANENCEIEPGKRSVCAYCRYKKCLSIGMSKDAIKTGRYTHEKKTRDIEEVKRLQGRESVQNKARGISIPKVDIKEESEREEELEKIIKHITAAHLLQTPHPPDFFQTLPQKEAEYLEKRALKEKVFGPMKPIPREEYQQIYRSTGIDIDGRREMISSIIPCIERAIKRFITFAKALPGFKDLPIEDQIALIKASRPRAMLVSIHRSVNVQDGLVTTIWGRIIHKDILKTFHGDDMMERYFACAKALQTFHLQVPEIALLEGILITCPAFLPPHVTLKDPAAVRSCCDILVEAFRYWLSRTRPDDVTVLERLLTASAALKHINLAPHAPLELFSSMSLEAPALLLEMCL